MRIWQTQGRPCRETAKQAADDEGNVVVVAEEKEKDVENTVERKSRRRNEEMEKGQNRVCGIRIWIAGKQKAARPPAKAPCGKSACAKRRHLSIRDPEVLSPLPDPNRKEGS